MVLQSATEELERLEHAFDSVKKQLFDRLHGILREQLFHDTPIAVTASNPSTNGLKPAGLVTSTQSDSESDDVTPAMADTRSNTV